VSSFMSKVLSDIFTNLRIAISHYIHNIARKFACSISDGFLVNFCCLKPFARTITLGSIKLVTEMSSRIISWG